MISSLLSDSSYLKLKEPPGANQKFCLEAMEYTRILVKDICNNIKNTERQQFLWEFLALCYCIREGSYCILYILWLFIDLSFWEVVRSQNGHNCTFQPSVEMPLLVCFPSLRTALCWILKIHKPYEMRWD